MPRISMEQAYNNRDVIAQIYKMLADVADSVAKATEAVAKALEAMETAEAAEEAVADKQDALTEAQLLAVDSGITAEDVAQIGTNATAIEGLDERTEILASTEDANVGDALVLDENKDPAWVEMRTGMEFVEAETFTINAHSSSQVAVYNSSPAANENYIAMVESVVKQTGTGNVDPSAWGFQGIANKAVSTWDRQGRFINNSNTAIVFTVNIYKCKGNGDFIIVPSGEMIVPVPTGSGAGYYNPVNNTVDRGVIGPSLSSSVVGKFLKVKNASAVEWADILPSYSAADAGKVLSVNSSGELEWITLP